MTPNKGLSLAKILLTSIVAIIACSLFFLGVSHDYRSEPTPLINVSRSQYDEALAKWRARGVKEYEIMTIDSVTLGFEGGYSILRVSAGGSHMEVVHTNDNFKYSENKDDWLKFRTVEGLFAFIEKQIALQSQMSQSGEILQLGDPYYTTQFNRDLGYPTFIEGHPFDGPDAEGRFSKISDSDWTLKVDSVTILK